MNDSSSPLGVAIREGELNAEALLESALLIRDLRTAMREAISAIDRKSYERARLHLVQALDEVQIRRRGDAQ